MWNKCTIFLPILLSGCGLAAVGGIGTVGMSAVEDRGLTGVASDQILRIKVDTEIYDQLADASEIDVTVYKGRVLLTGIATSEKAKGSAVRAARSISGVKDVIDGMNIEGEDGFSEYTRDAWMTTKLKASLYADEDVMAPNYLVTTFDKVIYIFGTAYSKEEMQRVVDAAYDITGVKKVVNLIEVTKAP
ncbi:MAG TPA: BON domain-containing protein [Alphaproteobacteria bacterium]|nr:BON domain-containing protein [Alphaproteobacteria bacterium]